MSSRFTCKPLPAEDLRDAFQFNKEYINELETFAHFEERYKKSRELYGACYQDDELIGLVYGYVKEDFIILYALAVLDTCWRKGIGSKMLGYFEKQAKKLGFNKVSVGSAPDYKTESFYLKNGYEPVSLLIQQPDGEKIVQQCKEYGADIRERVRKEYGTSEVIFIFDKIL